MLDSLEPKYDSQLETLLAIDKLFFKSLKKRDSLIKDDEKGYSENIKTLDLQISMCIKKRGKVTKGGFNYILVEMWDWRPHFPMDSRLLPKIIRNLN